MIERADVLIENMRPGTLDRLGLGYPQAKARNPRLIYCSISGYGQNGPARDDPAMDLIIQAASGLISITGVEGGERVRCGFSVADITAGLFALIGILLALEARHRTGAGQLVDVSMLDAMISAMASNYAQFLGSGVVPVPIGTGYTNIVPYRSFPTADEDIVIAVASPKLWQDFCAAIDRPQWIDDPRFATNPLRVRNRAELEPRIAEIFRGGTCASWIGKLTARGVPCTPVCTLAEVAANSQTSVREMFPPVDGGCVTGPPVKFSATPGFVPRRAPLLGQHTREALSDLLGLDAAKLDALAAEGVIKSPGW